MTITEVLDAHRAHRLPPTLDADPVAALWGISTWQLYALERAGTAPVRALHLGRKLRWPTLSVLQSIGFDVDPATEGL